MAGISEVRIVAAADLLKVALESQTVTLAVGTAVEQAEELGDAFGALLKKIKAAHEE